MCQNTTIQLTGGILDLQALPEAETACPCCAPSNPGCLNTDHTAQCA